MKRRIKSLGLVVLLGIALLASGQTNNSPRAERARDPVCGLMVDKNPEMSAEYKGRVFYFCSKTDRDEFRKNPGKYVK
jgi:YHS domain-containing protein